MQSKGATSHFKTFKHQGKKQNYSENITLVLTSNVFQKDVRLVSYNNYLRSSVTTQSKKSTNFKATLLFLAAGSASKWD